jgi:hypothetical protein
MERNIFFVEILRTARSTSVASTGSWCCTHARADSSGSRWSSAVIGWQTSTARTEIVSAKYDFIKNNLSYLLIAQHILSFSGQD